MSSPGAVPPVVLAQRVRPTWRRIRPGAWLLAPFGVTLALAVLFAVKTGQAWWLLFPVACTLAAWLGWLWVALRPTSGTAWADPAGVHWTGRFGSFAYPWPVIDWIELARDQPGGRLFNRLDPASTTRTGRRIGIAIVVDGVPHYVHPVWTAADTARIDFGCALAGYARAQGVRVRVLQGDWGAENANTEPKVL